MIKIAVSMPPEPGLPTTLMKQCGVEHAVGGINLQPVEDASDDEQPWSYASLERAVKTYEQNGIELAVIESRPPMEKTKLALPGRDEEIDVVCTLLRNMGALGIPVWCSNWMPILGVMRTSRTIPSRAGATVSGFDHAELRDEPLTEHGVVTEEDQWANLKYFLERTVPVAEEAGVRMAMHPDDPPLSPIRGVARIMSSVENYQKLIDLVPSPANGIGLCQGNFTLMTDDLPVAIRHFGMQNKIFFVHFRDVRGTPEKFEETFADNGQTDMAACMRAYRDIEFDGVCRPDHVPTMDGDSNDRPGYSTIGRLFALGYIRGLQHDVYAT